MSRRILLHICCGPCATAVLENLRERGYEVHGFFYNPSIHPWKEFRRRLDTLKEWAPGVKLPLETFEEYPLEENIGMLLSGSNRCAACFNDRMLRTAEQALEMGIQEFTTTLTISPYQNQTLIREAGEGACVSTGVKYRHFDFRELYRSSIRLSREQGMYRQPYCGCVFSERDRYLKIKSPGELHPQNGY